MNKNIIFRGDVDLSTVKVYMLTPNCVLEPKHCKKHDKVLDVKPTQDGFSVSFICVGVHGKKFKPLQVYITAESKRELLCSQQFTLIGARDEARIREFADKHEQPILPLPPLPPVPQVPTQFQKNAPGANPPPSTQLDPNELTALYQGNTPNGTTESMDTQDDPAILETAAFQNSLKEERMEITQDDPVTLVTPSLDNFLNEDSKNRYADFKLSRFDN